MLFNVSRKQKSYNKVITLNNITATYNWYQFMSTSFSVAHFLKCIGTMYMLVINISL